jgi:hypothetical protein
MSNTVDVLGVKVPIPPPEEYKKYVTQIWNYQTKGYLYTSVFDIKNLSNNYFEIDPVTFKKGPFEKDPEKVKIMDYYINNWILKKKVYKFGRNSNNYTFTPIPLSKILFGTIRRSKYYDCKEYLEILKVATAPTSEAEIMELLTNNSFGAQGGQILEEIQKQFKIIELVKTKSGRATLEKVIYKTKSPFLINTMIAAYCIDTKAALTKALATKMSEVVYPLFISLTKPQKTEFHSKIIRILPALLSNPECPLELITELESIDTIRWNCYGPEPGEFSDYYSSKTLKEVLIDHNTNHSILEYVFEKIKPEITIDDLQHYLSKMSKNKWITDEFYDVMAVFKKYSKLDDHQ